MNVNENVNEKGDVFDENGVIELFRVGNDVGNGVNGVFVAPRDLATQRPFESLAADWLQSSVEWAMTARRV